METRQVISQRALLCTPAAFAAASMLAPHQTQASGVDFSNKTIEFVTPFGVGGGSDT